MTVDDLRLVLEWRNSETIRSMSLDDHVVTWDEHQKWFEKTSQDPRYLNFVCWFEDMRVGVINVSHINPSHRSAHWGIYLGDPTHCPPGSGAIFEFLLLERLFEQEKMRKIYCEVIASNKGAMGILKKLGFKEEGRLNRHLYRNGMYEDVIQLAQFEDEWGPVKEKMESLLFHPAKA